MTSYSYFVAFSAIPVFGSLCVGVSMGYMIHLFARGLWEIIARIRRNLYSKELQDEALRRINNVRF